MYIELPMNMTFKQKSSPSTLHNKVDYLRILDSEKITPAVILDPAVRRIFELVGFMRHCLYSSFYSFLHVIVIPADNLIQSIMQSGICWGRFAHKKTQNSFNEMRGLENEKFLSMKESELKLAYTYWHCNNYMQTSLHAKMHL